MKELWMHPAEISEPDWISEEDTDPEYTEEESEEREAEHLRNLVTPSYNRKRNLEKNNISDEPPTASEKDAMSVLDNLGIFEKEHMANLPGDSDIPKDEFEMYFGNTWTCHSGTCNGRPNQMFWEDWKKNKDSMKEKGYRPEKQASGWVVWYKYSK